MKPCEDSCLRPHARSLTHAALSFWLLQTTYRKTTKSSEKVVNRWSFRTRGRRHRWISLNIQIRTKTVTVWNPSFINFPAHHHVCGKWASLLSWQPASCTLREISHISLKALQPWVQAHSGALEGARTGFFPAEEEPKLLCLPAGDDAVAALRGNKKPAANKTCFF